MATPFRITYDNFNGGINDFSSPFAVGANESPFAINTDFQAPGKLRKSLGYTIKGTAGSTGGIKGLFVYRKETGDNVLLKVWDDGLYEFDTDWGEIGSSVIADTDITKVEGVNVYADGEERLYMTREFKQDLIYYNGTTTGTITDVKAKYIEQYKDRIYIANVKLGSDEHPQRVSFSPEGEDTFAGDDFFDSMGEPITGLKAYSNYLYVFSENKVGRWDGYAFTFIPSSGGTTSQRSVQESEGRLLWYNRQGVYMYAGAEMPVRISKRVQGWIEAIEDSSEVVGGIDKFGRYLLSIGDVTYKGEEYEGVVLIYDVLNNNWEVQTDRGFGVMTVDYDDGAITAYGGSKIDDKVYTLDSSYGVDGGNIDFVWQTTILNMGLPEKNKNIFKAVMNYKPIDASGFLSVEYRLNGASSWTQCNSTANNLTLDDDSSVMSVKLFPNQVQAKYLEFRVKHTGTLGGWEIYSIELEGTILNE